VDEFAELIDLLAKADIVLEATLREACSASPMIAFRRRARTIRPTPRKIRRRLRSLIEKARTSETMPWPEGDARMWQIVFPDMAKWLPADEAEQLRFEFAREMGRLMSAA
jgi:hypothetical protein